LLTIIYAPKMELPRETWSSSSFSFVFLLGLFSFFILYLLQRSYYDFYNEGVILVCFVFLFLGGLISIFYTEHQRERPLFRLRDILTKRYVAGVGLFCVCYLLIGMNNYVQPQYLSTGLKYYWESIGVFQAVALLCTLVIWMPVMRFLLPKYPSPVKYWVFAFGSL
ncbi:arabinose ABC transporter permease, partial [Pseudomonas aeruginosa]|nr:arabinose ABC transporter permease [Pseudomonas aeruginosa]